MEKWQNEYKKSTCVIQWRYNEFEMNDCWIHEMVVVKRGLLICRKVDMVNIAPKELSEYMCFSLV